MINHARTLLLNRDGVGHHGYVGEEYSPTEYHAVELPSFCHNVRLALFGQQPDWLMYNYRARELMQMLHATELAGFVTDLDSRVTYSFDNLSKPFESVFPFQRGAAGSTNVLRLTDGDNVDWYRTIDNADPSVSQTGSWTTATGGTEEDIYYNNSEVTSNPATSDGDWWQHRINSVPWGVYRVYWRWKKSTQYGDPQQKMQLRNPYIAEAISDSYWDVENKTPADYEHITLPGRVYPSKSFDFAYLGNVQVTSGLGPEFGQLALRMYHTGVWQNYNYFDAWHIERIQPEPGLTVTSTFETPDVLGRCYQQWRVKQTDTQYEITHETTPRKFAVEDAEFTDELGHLVTLPESSLQFQANRDPGAEWRVEAYTRPQRGLGDLEAAIAKLGPETMLELFHVGDPEGQQEPWQTFRNLWENHNETAYRLGAVVLALIYHTHAIWDVG